MLNWYRRHPHLHPGSHPKVYAISPLRSNQRNTDQALLTVQKVVNEICASVPFHLNVTVEDAQRQVDLSRGNRVKKAAAGAYFLLVPLYEVLRAPGVSEIQKKWSDGRLPFFAENLWISERSRTLMSLIHQIYHNPFESLE